MIAMRNRHLEMVQELEENFLIASRENQVNNQLTIPHTLMQLTNGNNVLCVYSCLSLCVYTACMNVTVGNYAVWFLLIWVHRKGLWLK